MSEFELESLGYAITPDAMRGILASRDREGLVWCLDVIASKQYTQLAPDVKRVQGSLDCSEFLQRLDWIECARCLFAVDLEMSEKDQAGYLAKLRQYMFNEKMPNEGWRAYQAIKAARECKGVDIKADLLRFAKPELFPKAPKEEPIRDIFWFYGNKGLTQSEVVELRDAWKGNDQLRELIVKKAQQYGLLLNEAPDAQLPSNSAPCRRTPQP